MDNNRTDVFVSYKAEDRPRVQPLVNALEADGFSVWWDAHIGGGTDWRSDIEEHLADAKCVLVVWSKRSITAAGNFVKDEATRAQRAGTYLPVRIDRVEPPLGFGEVQALDLEGWKGKASDPRFRAVADAVRAKLEGRALPKGVAHTSPAVTRRAAMVGGGVLGVAALGGASYWLVGGKAEAKRIAVMPFANLSGDASQDYLSGGLSEELRSSLSKVGMEVIGRTSSDAVKDKPVKQAAAELDAANLLTGSVRTSPNLIRINAQLVSGKDGVEKWSQSYDRKPGDIIQIQTDIATSVAHALTLALGSTIAKAIELGGTKDAEAQRLYQETTQLLRTKGVAGIEQALVLLDAALARDPNYIDAMTQKSALLTNLGGAAPSISERDRLLAQSSAIANRAVDLAPNYGLTHSALGQLLSAQLKLRDAAREYRAALDLMPNDVRVMRLAVPDLGLLTEPAPYLATAEKAVGLDPLNQGSYGLLGYILFYARKYEQSNVQYHKALALAPERHDYADNMAVNYAMMNRFGEARAALAKADPEDIFARLASAIIAARSGDKAAARGQLDKMKTEYGDGASYQYAQIHAQLGQADDAFAALDTAIKVDDPGISTTKNDPMLDPIRKDPRMAAVIKRIGFPET